MAELKPVTTVAELTAAFPDLAAALRAEGVAEGMAAGATAERERLSGIDAHLMPGHEQLIADCKADPKCTPDMAAGRVIAAEKQLRGNHAAAIKRVEDTTGKVAAAPAAAAPNGGGDEKATTPEGWKAEYQASQKLQSEFATCEDYVALKAAEAGGKVRVLHGKVSK